MIGFKLLATDEASGARLGRLSTPHGVVETPAFMPVGTYGAVKGMRAQDLEALGAQIVLSNAYHLSERPGAEAIRDLGGIHQFMGWYGPILTDSGGYQVMSMADRCEVDDDGVTFRSPLDGARRRLTPESVIEIQACLGVDIAMVLDECVANPSDRQAAARAAERSRRWAERSRTKAGTLAGGLFGIVQGGVHDDLRRKNAEQLVELEFDGYAVGGLSVGESKASTWAALEAALEVLPQDRPRYVMGMGTPGDLLEGVLRGADMFDCVMPTRHARNGVAFTRTGRVTIRNAKHRADPRPLDEECACPTCARYSRAYLRHLKVRGEMLAGSLMTLHNLWFYLDTMRRIRHAIASGAVVEMRAELAHSGSRGGD